MVSFRHSVERSWWRRLLETLELLPRLAADAANAAALRACLAEAAVLDTDVTPAALAALPHLLDLNVFETRLPPGLRGVGLRLLRLAWLPRRVLLLRLLRHALAAEAGETAAAERALREACAAATAATAAAATPAVAPGGGQAAAAAAAAACLGGEADEPWAALLSMARVTVLLSRLLALTEGGAAAEAEPPATQEANQRSALEAELLEQVAAYSGALVAQAAALGEALGAAGGFAPAPLRAATHLLRMQLPCLCVLQQRWAQQLPAPPKRKKKGEGAAEEEAPQPAEPTDLRGALRAASARVAAALAELQEGLGAPEPLVCALLREAPLREHLGGGEAAQRAHQHVLDALLAAGKTSVATLQTALKHAIAALRQTSKQL